MDVIKTMRPCFAALCSLALTLYVGCCPLSQAATLYEGKPVTKVEFVPPKQPVDEKELWSMVAVKAGQPLRMADVRATVDRLWATGAYADIQVDAEPDGDGVRIRFLSKNSWFIGRVSAEGKVGEPPNFGQLANATKLDLGQPYSEEEITEALAGLKQLLESNGYYESKIQSEPEYDPNTQQLNLRFLVTGGKRAKYRKPDLKGDTKMPERKILSATHWRRWILRTWKPVTQQRTRRGIDGILAKYQKADRLAATVALESMDYDSDSRRVKPTLNINGGPRVVVKAIGKKISKRKLRRYLPIYEEHAVDRDLLVEGTRNLRDYLQAAGFFEAEIEFKEQRIQGDRAEIDYMINPGKRHQLVHLEVQGNKYFNTDTIRERMFLQAKSIQFRHGRYSESFLRRDEDAIKNLYRSNGFRDVQVTEKVVDDYQGKVGNIAVFIVVNEGPQWFVGHLDVSGIEQLNTESIVPTLSSSDGQPFSEFNVAVDRDAVLAFYYTHGFPNATFEWSFTPTSEANRVNLRYVIREGKQQFIRDVLVSGLKTTQESLVDKNLNIQAGEPLSPLQMSETQRRLYDLGVFAKVDMAIQNPEGETQRKYVLYQMEEAHKYTITTGFGAEIARIGGASSTSLDSPAGKAGFSPRVSFDVTRLNFRGLGHSISLRTRLSNLQRRGILSYSAPRFRNIEGRSLAFTLLYDDSRDVRTFRAKREEGSVQLSQKLSKPTTALLRFSYRRVSTSNVVIPSLLVPQLLQPVRIGMLSGNLIQDRRDDATDARKGIYSTIDLGLASHIFGSQRNFLRGLGRNATYHRIGKKLVLARETSLGLLFPFHFTGTDSTLAIPFPERFFGGGGSSHRGFPENQAGPRDLGTPAGPATPGNKPTGLPLGGNALVFNNTELRFPLIGDNIGGVLFHDAGNVYRSISDISFRFKQRDLSDFDYMVHAAGFGVRYRTPVGPIRVDLAYSINAPRFVGFKGTYRELLECKPGSTLPQCQSVAQRISRFQFFFSIGQTF